ANPLPQSRKEHPNYGNRLGADLGGERSGPHRKTRTADPFTRRDDIHRNVATNSILLYFICLPRVDHGRIEAQFHKFIVSLQKLVTLNLHNGSASRKSKRSSAL